MKVVEQGLSADRIPKVARIHSFDHNSQPAAQILNIETGHKERFIADDFRWGELIDLIGQFRGLVDFRQHELSCRHVTGSYAEPVFRADDTHEEIVTCLIASRKIHVGPGSHDTRHFTLYQTFCQFRVFDLVADGYFLAFLDQTTDIGIHRMVGNAAHRRSLRQTALLSCQRDFQHLRNADRIFEEHFIKISDAVHKYAVLIIFLYFFVLLHHRR